MTIKKLDGPLEGNDVLQAALETRFPAFKALGTPVGGSVNLAGPIPYFRLSLDALEVPDPLTQAEQTGWRVAVNTGADESLAKLSNSTADSPTVFQGLAKGNLVKDYLKAAELAEKILGPESDEYEPRLLDIPSVPYAALWLKGTSDFFVPLLVTDSSASASLDPAPDILSDLRERVRHEEDHAGEDSQAMFDSAPSTPTN